MAECELIEKCVFFNDEMANAPTTAEMTKSKYCRRDNSECARYIVFKAIGREKVPPDLFPHQVYRVKDIILKG
ncbi:MAG: hypothetical protein AB1632_06515 [Nitrospirota bacterium]